MRPEIKAVYHDVTPANRLQKTVGLIGEGIRAGATYQPLRLHAANVATRAPRRDYLGQVKAIYDDFLKRWRYVRDIRGLETVATTGPAIWGLVAGAYNKHAKEYGHGDCDDATAYLGAAARAIGLPVRIVTMSKPGRPAQAQSHVYPEIQIPKVGWVPADPVAHPAPFGTAPPASSRIKWDLYGREIGKEQGDTMNGYTPEAGMLADIAMNGWSERPLEDYGLAGLDADEPEDWGQNVVANFGAYADHFGTCAASGAMAEVEPLTEDGYAMTPILELGIADYMHIEQGGKPYVGMLAFGEDGAEYEFQPTQDGLSGFFKRLKRGFKKIRRRVKRTVRKVARKAIKIGKRVARKVIKRLPGGKYLLKFGRRLKKIAMKLVKPLAKYVGKAAPFLAKVAAFVPGYGPAIAAGLYKAGKIAQIMNKFGVVKKMGKLSFKSGGQMKQFKSALAKAAKEQRAAGTAGLGALPPGLRRQIRRGFRRRPRWRRRRRIRRRARRAVRRAIRAQAATAAPPVVKPIAMAVKPRVV